MVSGVYRLSMRILHLIPHLSGGGAERQLSYLASELVKMGWYVHVAFLEEGPNAIPFYGKGIYLHKLKYIGHYDPWILSQVIHLIKLIRPDVMQTWILQMDILGGIASYLTKTLHVLREPSIGINSSHKWKNDLRGWLAKRIETSVVSNSKGGDQYWSTMIPQSNCYIIPNALKLDEIEESLPISRDEIGLPKNSQLILYAGRLDYTQKNVNNLVIALNIICKKNNSYAVICGDGPKRSHLMSSISNNGLADRILLKGFVSNMWSFMKASDVFVSVSYFEGRPNTVIEAMACACPVVVSDIPAHREILDEESAVFVNPDDPSDIAEGISKVLMLPAEAKKRAEKARKIASQWSIAEMTRNYEKVYKELI